MPDPGTATLCRQTLVFQNLSRCCPKAWRQKGRGGRKSGLFNGADYSSRGQPSFVTSRHHLGKGSTPSRRQREVISSLRGSSAVGRDEALFFRILKSSQPPAVSHQLLEKTEDNSEAPTLVTKIEADSERYCAFRVAVAVFSSFATGKHHTAHATRPPCDSH